MKPTTTLQTQANTGKHRQFHLQTQAISSLPYKKFMGFYRERTKCQFLRGPTYGPAYGPASGSTHAPSTTTLGPPPLARILQPRCQQQRRRPAPFTPLPPSPTLQLNNNARHPTKPPRRHCTSRTAPPAPPHQPSPQHCCAAVAEQPLSRPPNRTLSRPHPSSHPTGPIHSVTTFSHDI